MVGRAAFNPLSQQSHPSQEQRCDWWGTCGWRRLNLATGCPTTSSQLQSSRAETRRPDQHKPTGSPPYTGALRLSPTAETTKAALLYKSALVVDADKPRVQLHHKSAKVRRRGLSAVSCARCTQTTPAPPDTFGWTKGTFRAPGTTTAPYAAETTATRPAAAPQARRSWAALDPRKRQDSHFCGKSGPWRTPSIAIRKETGLHDTRPDPARVRRWCARVRRQATGEPLLVRTVGRAPATLRGMGDCQPVCAGRVAVVRLGLTEAGTRREAPPGEVRLPSPTCAPPVTALLLGRIGLLRQGHPSSRPPQ